MKKKPLKAILPSEAEFKAELERERMLAELRFKEK